MRFQWRIAVLGTVAFALMNYFSFLEIDKYSNYDKFPTFGKVKQRLWEDLKIRQNDILSEHQYCMLWCPESQFGNISEWTFYRDLSPAQAQEMGSYSISENRALHQLSSAKRIEAVCCQIATRNSFEVIYDTRSSEDLDNDISLVTFGGFERISALLEISKRWKGQMVIVVYIPDYNDPLYETLNSPEQMPSFEIYKQLKAFPKFENTLVLAYHASFWKDRNVLRIGYNAHYFEKDTLEFDSNPANVLYTPEEAQARNLVMLADFPINTLRNVAQDFAQTRYVFAIDMDFLPDNGAHEYLRANARRLLSESSDNAAIILPHFNRFGKCTWKNRPYEYPSDFKALNEQFNAGIIRPFYINGKLMTQLGYHNWTAQDVAENTCPLKQIVEIDDGTWLPGIELTNYPKWFKMSLEAGSPLEFEINATEKHISYEPYFVLDRVTKSGQPLMRYNEVFANRQKDKSSWLLLLRIMGYRFYVANQHFLVHQDHPGSPWTKVHQKKGATNMYWTDERMLRAAWVYKDTLEILYSQKR
jgi:hypothetical protein